MPFRKGVFACIALALVIACAPATAVIVTISRSIAPECRDPPPSDPVANFESLPTHAQITEYLSDDRTAPQFKCSSARLAYVGMRDKDGIRVVSRYMAGGRMHAETYSQRVDNGWSRHGIVRTQRRDGGVQSLEYFCNGFEVGLHRYFDAKGNLSAVADYSRSDYEWEKNLGRRTYRDFYVESGMLGSEGELRRAQRFREVYLIRGERAERVAFAATDVFDPRWKEIDPASTVKQWTQPGMHGPVIYSRGPTQIRNYDFDYVSFAEVYQRKRLGAPGARPPQAYHSLLLECPWIDEAMQPGLSDTRFSFEPPIFFTESQLAASPERRFEACMREPKVRCLLDQALVRARSSQPLTGREMREFADDALAAGEPALARLAMEEVLADTRGHTSPSSYFALQATIKSQAEAALGLSDEARKSADTAFTHAMGYNTHAAGRAVHILEAIGPRLARIGAIERAHDAFREVPLKYAEDAFVTLEEIGIAQARQGDVEAARNTIEELVRVQVAAQGELSADPFAVVEIAAGQVERGDMDAAAATLAMIPVSPKLTPSQAQQLNAKAIAVRARLPSSDVMAASIEQALAGSDLTDRLTVARAYCESGKIELGVATLARARDAQGRPGAEALADLGATEAACGRVERAQSDFRAAKQAISRMPPDRGLEIGMDPDQRALLHLHRRMLDAGLLDSLPDVSFGYREQLAIDVALKRAELGDPQSAWSALDSIEPPDPEQRREELALNLALARARVLTQLSRNVEAEKEFALARQIALTRDDQIAGAAFSVRLAEVRLRNGQPLAARAALAEAQAAFFEGLLRRPGSSAWLNPGYGAPPLARAWAVAGNDAAAMKLMVSQTELRFRAIVARASDRINGELAVILARSGKAADSIASLRKVERWPWRVWFLSQVSVIAEQSNDKTLLATAESLWRPAFDELQRVLEDSNGVEERRRAYHAYLMALRMKSHSATVPQRTAALESLRSQLSLFGTHSVRVRAGCELAFTFQHLGQQQAATALFAESLSLATTTAVRNSPTETPAPQGACAYWMAAAGMSTQANSAMKQVFETWRAWRLSQGDSLRLGAQRTLQEFAIILSESEAGEIDLLTGTRLTQL